MWKAVIAVAVALAFILPSAAVFAYDKELTIGVLPIATVMMLSTVAVTANTNDESPEFMLASTGNNDGTNNIIGSILQREQTNTFDPDWIHFDDGTNVQAIGLTAGGTFEGAIRITPAELAGYDDYELTAVRWYHGDEPQHSGNIKIYSAGTSTTPGSVITSEPFTVPSTGWFEINLSNPVSIDVAKDIWVSVRVTHAAGEYPLGVAPGPVVPGKGGWISIDGVTWEQLGIDIPSLDYNWNIWAKVEMSSEPPETPQRPEGPTEGVVGVAYTFSTSTTDPEGEQVYYLWDWDDGTSSEWLGPNASGVTVFTSHAWSEVETYNIKVKAKDPHGEESDWSDPKTIHIVDTAILEIGSIIGGFVKVSAVIKNTGGVAATGVNWSITLDGGIILLGRETSGRILSIPAGGEKTVSSSVILGFGKTVITVSAETAGFSDTAERDAFVLLFFIKM